MINDGLWCAFENCHMGMSGEHVADLYSVGRTEQDTCAAASHRKAAHATREGWFKDEIAALKTAFKKDGSVTAGNAPGVNDGASAVVVISEAKAAALGLSPMVRIVAQATTAWRRSWF